MIEPISKAIQRVSIATRTIESPIEHDLAWRFMRNEKFIYCPNNDDVFGAGWFVFPQYRVGKYRADFLIKAYGFPTLIRVWPPKHITTIAIECDGKDFHDKEKDSIRDEHLKECGIETLRFSGAEIYHHPQNCIDRIISYIEERS